jgi:hypothetical protein
MRNTIGMESSALIYIPSFIKICSGIEKLVWGKGAQTGGRICLFLYFHNNENRLQMHDTYCSCEAFHVWNKN